VIFREEKLPDDSHGVNLVRGAESLWNIHNPYVRGFRERAQTPGRAASGRRRLRRMIGTYCHAV
jgi:hypothetical protein